MQISEYLRYAVMCEGVMARDQEVIKLMGFQGGPALVRLLKQVIAVKEAEFAADAELEEEADRLGIPVEALEAQREARH
jgi:hypothetical protein